MNEKRKIKIHELKGITNDCKSFIKVLGYIEGIEQFIDGYINENAGRNKYCIIDMREALRKLENEVDFLIESDIRL